ELVEELRSLPTTQTKVVPPPAWTEEKYRSIKLFAEQLTKQIQPEKKELSRLKYFERTQKLDRWLLHPFFGLFLFFAIMMALFSSIFWLADPFMSLIDDSFSWIADMILQIGGHSIVADLLANGFVASAGAVFVFVPQIFILFAGISFLEDSGYLARAATLIDKPFSRVGMSGRSFVPLLSGYACAVPAMMATRNIRSSKERWIAMFIIPLMTCSARLPVYALLLSFIFFGEAAWKPGLALAGLYFGSLIVGSLAAAIVNKIIGKTKQNSFLIELPYYHRPSLRVILRTAVTRTLAYIRRAGPIIFILAFLVWTGSTFPRLDGVTEAEQLEGSFIGHLGKIIEPVFEPMGSDWRVGIGLISAFAAREVFVSTLAVVFNIASEDEASLSESLIVKMKAASWPDGTPLFTLPSVAAILVFFMVALQCLSTFAMAQREMQSWQFAIAQLIVLNLVAYLLAIGTYQAFHFLG
ncbi:MAG: ferrous iron transporter B, partial [Bdellovibrionales bacterium]|nr:ferrous iron transporter B [Bdellovibrionales bacterium]